VKLLVFIRVYSVVFVVRSFFVLFLCTWGGLAQAAVMAHVDRFNISEGETVNLTIEVTGDDSGDPKTAPLQKDFEILSNNHSSSFTIVNGSTSSKSVYQLILRPRHAGPITIPPLKVGSTATSPIMIQVSKMQARTSLTGHPTGDVWLSMDIAPKQVRVQQQAIITIRVYQAVGLNQAQLTEPAAKHAVIERLGDDASYQKQENGRAWQITERRYALFPQQSGHIDINPVQLDGSILVGGASYFQTARPIRVRSNTLSLDVSGMVDGWSGDAWLPARDVSIEESWPQSNTKFVVGEPITRTLTLRADGLTASQLPELPHELPDNLKSYADKPVLKDNKLHDGVHGMRQEKIAIMPMQPGVYILPEIDIDWWNTATQQTEHATLPARTFTVVAASAASSAVVSSPPPLSQPPAKIARPVPTPVTQPLRSGVAAWWQWLAIIAAAGWLLTLVYVGYLRRSGNIRQRNVSDQAAPENLKQARKAIEAACNNDDAKACEQALLQMAHLQLAHHLQLKGMPVHSLAALADYCDETLKSEVLKLERLLYASNRSDVSIWRGEALLQAFRQSKSFTTELGAHVDKTDALPGLYPD